MLWKLKILLSKELKCNKNTMKSNKDNINSENKYVRGRLLVLKFLWLLKWSIVNQGTFSRVNLNRLHICTRSAREKIRMIFRFRKWKSFEDAQRKNKKNWA
jgi:hypothetical protein